MSSTTDKDFQASANKFITHWIFKRPKWEIAMSESTCSDCYGFVKRFYNDVANIQLPELQLDTGNLIELAKAFKEKLPVALQNGWEQVSHPEPFCVVAMGRKGNVYHFGLYHPDGVVVHVSMNQGVIARPLSLIQASLGYSEFKFYVHKDLKL